MTKTITPLTGFDRSFLFAIKGKWSSFNSENDYKRFEPQSKLARVNKKNPCQICERTTWCSYTEDGGLALCMRNSAGSIKTASNGAFIHVLNPQNIKRTSTLSAMTIRKSGNSGKSKTESYFADADQINELYVFLLTNLELTEKHADKLLNERGLSDTTIASKLYASVPSDSDLAELMEQIRKSFGDKLKGIAGFYKDEDNVWQFNKPQNGFFIPYRDETGRIQALQVRLDISGNLKYIWVSTNPDNEKFKEGTSSGAPLHFVLPDLVNETGEIILTEGALKADCISEFTGKSVVALAGIYCANFEELPTRLKNALPNLQTVFVAYDADFITNKQVKEALIKLCRVLKEFGFKGGVMQWNLEKGKGLDDLLLAENRGAKDEQ